MSTASATLNNDSSVAARDALENRRLRMLEALEIDVWQVRTGQRGAVESEPAARAAATTAMPGKRSGPAAARAVLEGLEDPRRAAPEVPEPPRSSEPSVAQAGSTPQQAGPVLDLWCLSGSHGVLLADLGGLGSQAQRFLSDLHSAAMRQVATRLGEGGAATRGGRARALAPLRFQWPPADQQASVHLAAPAGPALRGFLARQLEDKAAPVLIIASPALVPLLAEIELRIPQERRLVLEPLETLLGDGQAKRALWQTLKTL